MRSLAKYRYSRSTSPFDDVKGMYIIIGICAAAVIVALVVYLTLQGGSSPSPDDIPVVEQGDGIEDGIGTDYPDYSGDGIIFDDSGAPVAEFTVAVTDADGIYLRSDEGGEYRLTVSNQNSESFAYELSDGTSSTVGTAYFNGEYSALCEKAEGSLVFSFDAGAVYISIEGTVSDPVAAAGEGLYVFSEALPTTTTASGTETTTTTIATTAARTGIYDLDVLYSDEVQDILNDLLSDSQFSLMQRLLDLYPNGYGMINGNGPASMEVNGRSFNLDTELDAVMYYSSESGTGREVVILCADGPTVYVGLCDGSDYRYFTNDAARSGADSAPNTIVQYARIKSMPLSAD